MKKNKKIIICAILVMSIFCTLVLSVSAEAPISSTLYFSHNTVESGECVEVEATYRGNNIGRYEIHLKYDNTALQYLDGDNTGDIVFSKSLDEGTSSVNIKANFKALVGSSSLISTESYFYEFGTDEKITANDAGAHLTVEESENNTVTENSSESNNSEDVSTTQPNDTSNMNSIENSGTTTELNTEEAYPELSLKEELEKKDKCLYESQYCDVVYSLKDIEPPQNFKYKQSHYNDKLLDVYVSKDEKYVVAGIRLPEDDEVILAIYDSIDKTFKPFASTFSNKTKLIIVDANVARDSLNIVDKVINRHSYRVYSTATMQSQGFYIVNAINESGYTEEYLYDDSNGTFIKYNEEALSSLNLLATKQPSTTTNNNKEKQVNILSLEQKSLYEGLLIFGILAIFILLISVIVLSKKKKIDRLINLKFHNV
jgi:hypothetical protein